MTGDLVAAALDLGAAWFEIVAPASIRVAVILLLTWGAASLLRSQAAQLRSLVWTAGLTLALTMPLLTPALAGGPLGFAFEVPSTEVVSGNLRSSDAAPTAAETGGLEAADGTLVGFPVLRTPDARSVPRAGAVNVQTNSDDSFVGLSMPRIVLNVGEHRGLALVAAALGLLSLGGSFVLGARLLVGHARGWARTRRLPPVAWGPWAASIAAIRAHEGVPGRVRFVLAPGAVSPQTWGWLHPTVVLPAAGSDLTEAERRSVLRHELAHVERFDTLWLAAERLLVALFWWNSLVWPAQRRAQLEREQSCDDAVLGGDVTPSGYADQLLRQARGLRGAAGAAGVSMLPGAESQLRRRVGSILDPGVRRGTPRRGLVVLIVGAMFVAACSVSSVGVDSEPRTMSEWTNGEGLVVEERAHETVVLIEEDGGRLTATIPNGTRFASDTEIASISEGALEIEDDRGGPSRSLELEMVGATLEYRYRVDGSPRHLDADGREWFEATLLELFRRAGLDHEARVGRLHDDGGIGAVLEEVEQIPADFVASTYLRDLLDLPTLEDGAELQVIEALPRLVAGSFPRARVIERLDPAAVLIDEGLRDALVATLRSLEGSPFELGRALEGMLPGLAEDEIAFAAVLVVARDVQSDFERGAVLDAAAPYITERGPALDAWIEVAGEMGSAFDASRALIALLDRSVVELEMRLEVIDVVADLSDDFVQSQLLVDVAEHFSGSDEERDAYRAAARSIRSDFERGRALAAIDGYASR